MASGPAESLSIVVAAYNEVDALPRCVERTVDFARRHVTDGEILVVDDGSTDGTGALIDAMAAREPLVRAFHLPRNLGMGAALLRGFAEARRDWVTILPGDGQLDAFDLLELFDAATDADLVTTLYRNRRAPLVRRVLSIGLRALTALIVGTRARSEGAYLVRRDVLRELSPRSRSFMLNLEIPIRARRGGYRVKTVRMDVHDRIAGRSKAATPGRIARTFLDQLSLRVALERERLQASNGRARSR
jgi:glycosyltransferase involved in cell wall biosynthesis